MRISRSLPRVSRPSSSRTTCKSARRPGSDSPASRFGEPEGDRQRGPHLVRDDPAQPLAHLRPTRSRSTTAARASIALCRCRTCQTIITTSMHISGISASSSTLTCPAAARPSRTVPLASVYAATESAVDAGNQGPYP